MRLFIALEFFTETQERFSFYRDLVQKRAKKGTFVPDGNFHVTLLFLGDVDEARVDGIKRVMDSITLPPLRFSFERIGYFDPKRPGRIYWVGIRKEERLEKIYTELYKGLGELGFRLDKRPFSPHVTLGRRVEVDEAAEKAITEDFRPFQSAPRSLTLMLSERSEGRMVYTPLHVRPFPKEDT